MDFLEKDLEQIIWEANEEQLNKSGLYRIGKKRRQLKIGNYGIADLVTLRKMHLENWNESPEPKPLNPIIEITVYELKKDKIGVGAFLQACNYIKGIKRYIEKHKRLTRGRIQYRIVLIGKEIDKSGSFIFIPDLFSNLYDLHDKIDFIEFGCEVEFYTYKYEIDGLTFNAHSEYSLTDEGF